MHPQEEFNFDRDKRGALETLVDHFVSRSLEDVFKIFPHEE